MNIKLTNKIDHIFSLYIRLRDAMPGGMCRCISCGRLFPLSQMDCGHFYSRSNMATRWNENNCNAECVTCNRYDTNHLKGYERNLIVKIGKDKFDELRILAHGTKKYSEWEIEEMVSYYSAEVKRIKKEKGL